MPHNPTELNRAGRYSRRAFTLIELLLVLVILAVLASIAVPRFAKRSEQAKTTAASADISAIELALDAFEIDCGQYPAALDALVTPPANSENWKGPYLKKGVPMDPWGNAYAYHAPGQHNATGYDLSSFGPDATDGTADDITNWAQK